MLIHLRVQLSRGVYFVDLLYTRFLIRSILAKRPISSVRLGFCMTGFAQIPSSNWKVKE